MYKLSDTVRGGRKKPQKAKSKDRGPSAVCKPTGTKERLRVRGREAGDPLWRRGGALCYFVLRSGRGAVILVGVPFCCKVVAEAKSISVLTP